MREGGQDAPSPPLVPLGKSGTYPVTDARLRCASRLFVPVQNSSDLENQPRLIYDGAVLLTISTTHQPATDLGFLVHKNPSRFQSFTLPFGRADVFYPEAERDRCTVALLLGIDPVGLVRPKPGAPTSGGWLEQYVNDRPYVASSHLSVAIASVFGSARSWRSLPFRWKPASQRYHPETEGTSSRACLNRSATLLRFRDTPSIRAFLSGAPARTSA